MVAQSTSSRRLATPPCIMKIGTNIFQSDDYSPGVFTQYADLVEAAEFLELPARDVAQKVMKRMKGMARMQREQDRRVSFDELGMLTSSHDLHRADVNRGLLRDS